MELYMRPDTHQAHEAREATDETFESDASSDGWDDISKEL